MGLSDLLQAYGQGVLARKYGPGWQEQMRGTRIANDSRQMEMDQMALEREEIQRLVAEGKLPTSSLKALELLEKNELRDAQTKLYGAQADFYKRRADDPSAFLRPMAEPGTYTWVKGIDGNMVLYNPKVDKVASGPDVPGLEGGGSGTYAQPDTAGMREAKVAAEVMPAVIGHVRDSLEEVKRNVGWMNGVKAFIPGTKPYMVAEQYIRNVTGLSTYLGRALGEKGVFSDRDRPVYMQMLGVANKLAMTPPGSELAEQLLSEVEALMASVQGARASAGLPARAGEVGDPANNIRPEDLEFERRMQAGSGMPSPVNTDGVPPAAPAASGIKVRRLGAGGPIVQHSLDGGKTWQTGPPPAR